MEAAKRKRTEKGEGKGRRKKVNEAVKEVASEAASPKEEEVEEFFAILRRMNVVVKYFEKGKDREEGGQMIRKNWRTALETEAVAVADGVKKGERVEESRVLDLNVVPDQAEINSA